MAPSIERRIRAPSIPERSRQQIAPHEPGRIERFVRQRPALSIGIAGVVAALFEAELIAAALIGGAAALAVARRRPGQLQHRFASTLESVMDRI